MKGGIRTMSKAKYKVTDKFSKEVIGEILEVEQTDGLTAENLLEKAKSESSNLHNLFEWDNTIAGEKFRVIQARLLINEVKILVDDKEIYAFENVRVNVIDENDEVSSSRKYKSIAEVMTKDEYRNQMVKSAFENLKYWEQKYKDFSELKPIFVSIDKVKTKWLKTKK